MKKQLFFFVLFVLLVGCALLTSCMVGTPGETTPPTTVTPVFEGAEVPYDGNAHSIAVTGLPAGSTVRYSVNGGAYVTEVSLTDAGVYTVVANITLPAGYVPVTDMIATLTINKCPMPEAYKGYFVDGTVTYTGDYLVPTPATELPAGVTYRVEGTPLLNTGDTGKFVIVYTYADAAMNGNYENRLEDVDLTVTKADVDMSGVTFTDKTVPLRQATSQTIELTGTLPSFLNVSYEGGGMERGEYPVTATFSFKNPADANNYNLPAPMTATLTIGAGEFDLSVYNFADRTLPYTGSDNKPVFAAVEGLAITVTMKKDGAAVDEAIEPGEYEVTVSFTVTDATLYVEPDDKTFILTVDEKPLIKLELIDLSGITFTWKYSDPFAADGTEKTVTLSDETLAALAEIGVTVEEYENNVKTAAGDYVAVVYLGCDNEHKFAPGDSVRSLIWAIVLSEDESWSEIVSPK